MNDETFIEMFNSGRLKFIDNRLWYFHRRRKRWYEKSEDQHPLSGRARYRIDVSGTRRATIYKNRLVYLDKHRRSPDVVDHVNGNRFDDDPGNLQEHTSAESRRQGYEKWLKQETEKICNWFAYVAHYGEYPHDNLWLEIPV